MGCGSHSTCPARDFSGQIKKPQKDDKTHIDYGADTDITHGLP